jgi:hypothetical protein
MISNYIAIALRIIAIILFYQGIKDFFGFVSTSMTVSYVLSAWPFLIPAMVVWLLSVLLWSFALPISKKVASNDLDFKVTTVEPRAFLTICIAAIGLYVFTYAVIDLVYYIRIFLIASNSGEPVSAVYGEYEKTNTIATIVELAFGILLILKSRSVAKLINKVSS